MRAPASIPFVDRSPLALFVLFLVAVGASAPRAARAVPGILEPNPIDDETYTEQFIGFADLADGTYVQVLFGISNVGPGDGRGACRILIVDPTGASWTDSKVVDRSEWRYSNAPVPSLKIGACEATAHSALVLSARTEKGSVRVTLKAAASELRYPAHAARLGGDFYDLEILVPWAEAEAEIQIQGKPARSAKGFGYADHSRSKILPGKLAQKWIRFRGLNPADSRLVLVRYPEKGAPLGWYREQVGAAPVDLRRVALIPGGQLSGSEKGGGRSWRAMLDASQGGPWRITSGKLLYRYAPIEEHGVLGSMLSAVVGNPVTYTYRALLEDKSRKTRTEGIMEITLTDE